LKSRWPHPTYFAITLAALTLLLLLPVFIDSKLKHNRKRVYEIGPEAAGPLSTITKEIFDKKEEVDIAFIGPSTLWTGINAPVLKEELKTQFGLNLNILVLGSNWRGEDLYYLITRDLLAHRKVKMIAYQPIQHSTNQSQPHPRSFRWLLLSDVMSIMPKLPLSQSMGLYAGLMLAAPRHLLSLIRDNQLNSFSWDPNENLGWHAEETNVEGKPLVPWNPKTPPIDAEQMLYHSQAKHSWFSHSFDSQTDAPFLAAVNQNLAKVLRERDKPAIMLNLPNYITRHESEVRFKHDWIRHLAIEGEMIGIAPKIMFQGMSEEQIKNLFSDPSHLNVNGSRYFSKLIAPAIAKAYEKYFR